LNHSKAPVQLESVLREGVEVIHFGVGRTGYDPEKHVVHACGGAVLIFGYGHRPSLTIKGHVKLEIHSNAFESSISTQEHGSTLNSSSGFSANFMEKTAIDGSAKFVILVV
jgi:hypothetical protein